MNFSLSGPRYVSEIPYTEDRVCQEQLALNATVDAPYDLIAEGKGSLKVGSVVFHRLPREREPNAQLAYIEPQPNLKCVEIGTFHIDVPVEPEIFDRWLASGILQHRLSMTVSFGFTPPAGLQYGAGPDGWQSQTWFVGTHRVLVANDIALIMHPVVSRPSNNPGATERVA